MKNILMELGQTVKFLCSAQFWRMSVLWTLSLLYSYFQLWLNRVIFRNSRSYPRCSPPLTPSTKRPICVITGATSGLGAAAAFCLAKEGYFVVLAGRSDQELAKMVKEIKQCHPDAHLKALQVELLSFESMLKFTRSLQQWLLNSDMDPSIQLLVNNAGLLGTSGKLCTEGYDQTIGTNYIAAFALTNLLLPLLKSSTVPSRVVNVTSFTHRCVSDIQVDKETLVGIYFLVSKQYPCAQVYEYSKFCLLLLSYELHRQLHFGDKSHQVSVIAADPGVVNTNIMQEVPSLLSCLAVMVLRILGLMQSPANGVESIIDAALSPPEVSGEYFFGGRGRVIKSSELSYDTKLAEKLWTTSSELFLKLQLKYKYQAS